MADCTLSSSLCAAPVAMTCKDRMYASIMGAYAVDLLAEGKSNRLVAYRDGKFVDYDIDEALAMTKDIDEYEFNISGLLSN